MMSIRNTPCKGCGCSCHYCNDQGGLHLHAEIENLKQRLIEREDHIVKMETNFLKEAEKFPNGEMAAISEELLTWQDKYSRLYEAHKRVQKVNQNLEDKLLRIVDKCETEKNALTTEVSNLTRRLVDEKFTVARLQEENERYRNDVNLAIQLLQCKPSNFVSQKYDSLPSEMQQKVRSYLSNKRRQSDGNGNMTPKPEMKTIKVPIPTFPPTAMVYSVNRAPVERDSNTEEKSQQAPVDIVSAAIMAKVLEERERERSQTKHCETCTCASKNCQKQHKFTQTPSGDLIESNNHHNNQFLSLNNKVNSKFQLAALNVKDKSSEKSLNENSDFTLLATERVKSATHDNSAVNNWEDVDTLLSVRVSKDLPSESVTEGILVNIESSTENSSLNSLTSDSSSCSWRGGSGSGSNHHNSSGDLISFENMKPPPQQLHHHSQQQPTTSQLKIGPRHCSVRMQVGTNNILLDNVVDPYTPVLYKSRTNDALVHHPRSRSESSTSSVDEPIGRRIIFRTETEI